MKRPGQTLLLQWLRRCSLYWHAVSSLEVPFLEWAVPRRWLRMLQTGDSSAEQDLNRSGAMMNRSVEKVPDTGWKNVFVNGLKAASSRGRAVSKDHDPSTLPGQLKTFSLDEAKTQIRTSPKKTHDLKVSEAKVAVKKDNARQGVKAHAPGPIGGVVDGSPLRKTSPIFKGTKAIQSNTSAVPTTFLQIRSGSEFISPVKQRIAGDSIPGSVYGVDKQSIRGRNSPMESERQAHRARRGDDLSSKMDGMASSLGWDMDTNAWEEGVPFSEGKWVPLPERKSAKLSGSVDVLGQMGVTGSRMFPSDDGWETVPKRKKKGYNKNPRPLQTSEVRLNRAMLLQDSSGTTTDPSRAVEDFELMGKRLGTKVSEERKVYSIFRESHMDALRGRGSSSVSPGRQRHCPNSSDSVFSIKNPKRGHTDGVSRAGTSKTETNADNVNVGQKKGGSFSDDGDHEVVSSESDSQFYDMDDGEELDDMDDCQSDESEKSHGARKKAPWCRSFFQDLDFLSYEQIQDHGRQLHCPVCQGAGGWYQGLGPLVAHAKTMRKRRVKHHLAFADLLEEEIHLRGVQADSGTLFSGKWKGLQLNKNGDANQQIPWSPMVVIQNSMLDFDDASKATGMGNQEVMAHFKSYNPTRARHAHGPKGHRGMSLLLFEASPAGYHYACRLVQRFAGARRSRTDWDDPGELIFAPGGAETRILYGYMASKADIENFDRHNKGRNFIVYTLKPPQEVVLEPLRLMNDHSMKMIELEKEQGIRTSTFALPYNLQHREQELKALRQRADEQLPTNKQQLNDLEDIYRMERFQLGEEVLHKEKETQKMRDDHDESHRQLCQKLRMEQSEIPNQVGLSIGEQQHQHASMESAVLNEAQSVEVSLSNAQEYEAEHMKLQEKHHQLRLEFQRQQHEAAIALEKELKAEMESFLATYQNRWNFLTE